MKKSFVALLCREDTLSALEAKLDFSYLPQIAFENSLDQEEIYMRGMEKYKNSQVSSEAIQLGEIYQRQIEERKVQQVSIRWVNARVGYGLFAEQTFKAGCYFGEYTGIVRKNNRRYFEPLNHYCYEYPVLDEIGRSWIVDATQGNLTRFINHNSHPNLKPYYAFYKGFYHVIFVTLCDIEQGEQLSYDYGSNYWYLRAQPQVEM